jgi:integrase
VHLSDGYVIAGEKTDAGKDRIIPLPPNIPEISGFFAKWIKEAEPDGRLFAGSVSRFRDNIFYRPLVELGMISGTFTANGVSRLTKEPHLTPHSTRHTFASLSVAAGMQPENLQKIIGHANYTTTADIYVHTEAEQLRAEMAKLSR